MKLLNLGSSKTLGTGLTMPPDGQLIATGAESLHYTNPDEEKPGAVFVFNDQRPALPEFKWLFLPVFIRRSWE